MRRPFVLIGPFAAATLALAACGSRGELAFAPEAASVGAIETVLVATSRAPVADGQVYGKARSLAPELARFEISVPPDRALGSVTYAGRSSDPRTDFLVVSAVRLPDKPAFIRAIDAALAADPAGSGDGVLFVHGYNTNFAEGLYRHAQIQHDWEEHGASVHFSWPSAATLQGYVYDRESALFSRDALEQTIDALARSNVRRIDLFAHSMGCQLLMDTLRTMARGGYAHVFAKLNSVVLMSPDIEIDVFRLQAPPVLALGAPIYLLVSDNDRALALSARIRGERARLGDIRSNAEIGGLDVTILDLSKIDSPDIAGHFREAESPALIAYIEGLQAQGQTLFDEGKTPGLLDGGAALVQEGARIVTAPLEAPLAK